MTNTTAKQARSEPTPSPSKCETCGTVATTVYVDMVETMTRRKAYKAWDAQQQGGWGEVDLKGLRELPSEAKWHITCDKCYPYALEQEQSLYWFAVPQTWHDWMRKTAHLMGKSWLQYTNWERFVPC